MYNTEVKWHHTHTIDFCDENGHKNFYLMRVSETNSLYTQEEYEGNLSPSWVLDEDNNLNPNFQHGRLASWSSKRVIDKE